MPKMVPRDRFQLLQILSAHLIGPLYLYIGEIEEEFVNVSEY